MKSRTIALGVFLAMETAFAQQDARTAWLYGSFGTDASRGSFYVTGLQRQYTGSNTRTIFSRMDMVGVKIGTTQYRLNQVKTAPVYVDWVWDAGRQNYYDYIYAEYTVGAYTVACQYKLYHEGMMEIVFIPWDRFGNTGKYLSEIYVRMDYDLNSSLRDISEYVTTATNPLYNASTNEIKITRSPLTPSSDPGVERQVYAHFFDAVSPGNQLNVYVNPGFSLNPVDVYFKKYSLPSTFPINPIPVSGPLQNTAAVWGVTYGYTGSDQEAWFTLKPSAVSGQNYYALQINVARKFTGRSLKVNWTQHDGLVNPFTLNDFDNIKTSHPVAACNNRSFNDAMYELTGNNNTTLVGPTITTNPFPGVFDCTQGAWSNADIHAYMLANRFIPSADRTDYTKWYVQVDFLNVHINPGPTPTGVLLDCPSCDFGVNSPPYREGVVVFAPSFNCGNPTSMRNFPGSMVTFMEVIAHEIGHAIGMAHGWQVQVSPGCETLEGSAHTIPPPPYFAPTLRFSSVNTIQWYQFAPESLVKPGKYSTNFMGGAVPHFLRADGTPFH